MKFINKNNLNKILNLFYSKIKKNIIKKLNNINYKKEI